MTKVFTNWEDDPSVLLLSLLNKRNKTINIGDTYSLIQRGQRLLRTQVFPKLVSNGEEARLFIREVNE